ARTEGDSAILALPIEASELVPKGRLAYRSRSLVAQSPTRVRSIARTSADRTVEVAATAGSPDFNQWRLTRPVQAAAGGPSVARLATLLSGLRAEGFLEGTPEDKALGLDHPWLTVHWRNWPDARPVVGASPGAEAEHVLRVGAVVAGSSGSRYARLAGEPLG